MSPARSSCSTAASALWTDPRRRGTSRVRVGRRSERVVQGGREARDARAPDGQVQSTPATACCAVRRAARSRWRRRRHVAGLVRGLSPGAGSLTGAGIMLLWDDQPQGSVCTTNDVSSLIEDLQYTLGEGPCIDAHRQHTPIEEPDSPSRPPSDGRSSPARRSPPGHSPCSASRCPSRTSTSAR